MEETSGLSDRGLHPMFASFRSDDPQLVRNVDIVQVVVIALHPNSLAAWRSSAGGNERASEDIVERLCVGIDGRAAAVHAFVSEAGRRDRLLKEIDAQRRRWPDPARRPPLFGMPIGVKDIFNVARLPTRAGSELPASAFAGDQASCVTRCRDQGALIAGKTVTAEFAFLAPGPTRNPHNLGHTPGGSSSGSAAAVAAGLVPLALGTQTVGSVIRPAAYCGVVGFTPSHGRIPTDGIVPNAPSLDTVGVFAANVENVVTAAQTLCDAWRASSGRASPVLGVPVGAYLKRASREGLECLERQVMALRAAGLTVREIPLLDDIEDVAQSLLVVNRFELARSHSGWFAEFASLYQTQSAEAIRLGQQIEPTDYAAARRHQAAFRSAMTAVMADRCIDLWLAPSTTGPAPVGLTTTGDAIMNLPWSFAGMPALTIPAGSSRTQLPLGIQLVSRYQEDEQLLEHGQLVERVCRQMTAIQG